MPLKHDILSAENVEEFIEYNTILAATEEWLGLSKAGKTHDGGISKLEDSNGSSTLSDMDVDSRGVAINQCS